ncbi:hypothetical protein MAGR_19420 [Mycolicibacterium agri]|uniref:DUF5666 domain-containing protein n=1 Tax=Mycolicibacterium agri TaxID=36811 RepID=A0A7I9VYH9_MYCAG|nr:hypothetical protein MAGR_19420 [Mycolicibacterium agri]
MPHSKSNLLIGSIAASVGISSVLAAAITELVTAQPPAPATPPQAVAEQPLSEQGTLIAVTADSLTTRAADGSVRTYTITPNTTAITGDGGQASAASALAVNDQVTVVGTSRGRAAVATAVAENTAVGPQGRPMDFGL